MKFRCLDSSDFLVYICDMDNNCYELKGINGIAYIDLGLGFYQIDIVVNANLKKSFLYFYMNRGNVINFYACNYQLIILTDANYENLPIERGVINLWPIL